MAGRTVSMRFISIAVLAVSLACLGNGLLTRQLQGTSMIVVAICFVIGAATAGRIGFSEVPAERLWIIFWMPIALAIYAIAGFAFGLGHDVSWAVIALAYISGGRAANLRQMLRQG